MNKQRLIELAKVLESDRAQKHFNMSHFFKAHDGCTQATDGIAVELTTCGTTACIAGWAVATFRPDYRGSNYCVMAEQALDLDPKIASSLFIPNRLDPTVVELQSHGFRPIMETNPKKVAKVVRHLAKTGKVDWSVAYHTRKKTPA